MRTSASRAWAMSTLLVGAPAGCRPAGAPKQAEASSTAAVVERAEASPTPAVAAKAAEERMLSCSIESRDESRMTITFQFENRTSDPVLVFDGVFGPGATRPAFDPSGAYVWSPEAGVVLIGRRLFGVPPDREVEAPLVPLVRRVRPGERLEGRFVVPLPLVETQPFLQGNPRPIALEGARVACVVGYVRAADAGEVTPAEEGRGRLRYTDALVEAQLLEMAAVAL